MFTDKCCYYLLYCAMVSIGQLPVGTLALEYYFPNYNSPVGQNQLLVTPTKRYEVRLSLDVEGSIVVIVVVLGRRPHMGIGIY